MLLLGILIGAAITAMVMSIFSAGSYIKGYEDGQNGVTYK